MLLNFEQYVRLIPVADVAEAIKAFAEQRKKLFYLINRHCVVDIPQINNLVKEMTEENEK